MAITEEKMLLSSQTSRISLAIICSRDARCKPMPSMFHLNAIFVIPDTVKKFKHFDGILLTILLQPVAHSDSKVLKTLSKCYVIVKELRLALSYDVF